MPTDKLIRKPKEAEILSAIIYVLDVYFKLGHLDYHRISTTGIPTQSGKFRPNKAKGFPDLLVWLVNGIDLYVEVKSETGVLSESQLKFQERAKKMKRHYIVVRSVEDFTNWLQLYLWQKNPVT